MTVQRYTVIFLQDTPAMTFLHVATASKLVHCVAMAQALRVTIQVSSECTNTNAQV